MPAGTAQVAADAFRLPVRLRTLLAGALALGLGSWVYPRALSAWRLHHLANNFADYAACMVGPTGPGLLRDNPAEFVRLVERRIVAARPEEAPFRPCAKLAEKGGADHGTLRAHELSAEEFVEFGGIAADRAATGTSATSARALSVSPETLADLADRAWPFVRSGYTRLVKPSSHAKEAVHPVAAPTPSIGSGLPLRMGQRATTTRAGVWIAAFGSGANLSAYRSGDRGVTWENGRAHEATELLDGCPVDDEGRYFTFSADAATGHTVVMSLGPESAPYGAPLLDEGQRIVAASCDSRALVVALIASEAPSADASRSARLRLCPYRKPCTDLAHPPWGRRGLKYPFDIARVEGTTVVASTAHGITRVSSTRDDGRTWTPPAVAFDRESGDREGLQLPAPFRLMTLGSRVLLYGGGKSQDDAYWLLVSDDHGASFHSL